MKTRTKALLIGLFILLSLAAIGYRQGIVFSSKDSGDQIPIKCSYSTLFYEEEIPDWYKQNCFLEDGR